MATIGYAHLPIPAGGNSPTVPADLAALAEAIDPHLRHTVVDDAQRDEEFGDAPVHTLVTAEDGTMWLKTGPDPEDWVTIWEPLPNWRPITLASGNEVSTIACEVRRDGTHAFMRGRVVKSNGSNFDLPNDPIKVGSVPGDCIPGVELASWAASCSLGGTNTQAAGRMEVLEAGTSSSNGVGGDILFWFQGDGGTPYIDLSGDWWID